MKAAGSSRGWTKVSKVKTEKHLGDHFSNEVIAGHVNTYSRLQSTGGVDRYFHRMAEFTPGIAKSSTKKVILYAFWVGHNGLKLRKQYGGLFRADSHGVLRDLKVPAVEGLEAKLRRKINPFDFAELVYTLIISNRTQYILVQLQYELHRQP